MDREGLDEYIARSKEIIDKSPQMDEANTKKKLIESLIDILGWDTYSPEVQLEYPVNIATGTKKVDYALTLENTPVVFIEAKGLDQDLSEDYATQVTSYIHNQEGVEWGILTNGKRFSFFKYDGTPNCEKLGSVFISALKNNFDLIKTVSKESIEQGEAEKIAKGIQRRRRAVSKLRDEKESIASDITENVAERVGESVSSVVESEAKELVDRVVNEVENNGINGSETETDGKEVDSKDDVELTAGETVIETFSENTQSETYAKVVEYLLEERGLLDEISIPYSEGRKRSIINDEPRHKNGDEMSLPVELENGCYLETHRNKEGKERYIKKMAGKCGLGARFNW